ncbi:hypothetical protein [Desulfonatronum parangueonense]
MSPISNTIPHAPSLLLVILLALTLAGAPVAFTAVSSGLYDGYDECCSPEADSEGLSKSSPCILVFCPCGLCAPVVMAGKATSIIITPRKEAAPDPFPDIRRKGISMLIERPPEPA